MGAAGRLAECGAAREEMAAKKQEADRKAAEKRKKALERPPIIKGPAQDGVTSTKEFDLKFLFGQRELLLEERTKLVGQATRLEDEANQLIEDAEMATFNSTTRVAKATRWSSSVNATSHCRRRRDRRSKKLMRRSSD